MVFFTQVAYPILISLLELGEKRGLVIFCYGNLLNLNCGLQILIFRILIKSYCFKRLMRFKKERATKLGYEVECTIWLCSKQTSEKTRRQTS